MSGISYPEKADARHPVISISSWEAGALMRSHQENSGEQNDTSL